MCMTIENKDSMKKNQTCELVLVHTEKRLGKSYSKEGDWLWWDFFTDCQTYCYQGGVIFGSQPINAFRTDGCESIISS